MGKAWIMDSCLTYAKFSFNSIDMTFFLSVRVSQTINVAIFFLSYDREKSKTTHKFYFQS